MPPWINIIATVLSIALTAALAWFFWSKDRDE